MEEVEILKESKQETGDSISNHREYNFKDDKNDYLLRIEIEEEKLIFILSLNDNIEYNYETKMNLSTIVNKLELNAKKYSSLDSILEIFDKIYQKNNLFINRDNDEFFTLVIKFVNVEEESKYVINIYKHFMKIDDKFNMLYSKFKLMKNNNDINMEQINNKIIELNNIIEQKDKEIKNMKNKNDKNDIIINEINQKLINQEEIIKDLQNKHINLINQNKNNINDLINKHESEIKILNDKISELENSIKNINNDLVQTNKNNDNRIKEEINKIENKIKEQENVNKKINVIIQDSEYKTKKKYIFKKEPKNLKFKENITSTNTHLGWNDMFEVFISYKDNKEYLASPNVDNYKLDIYTLINNKKINSLSGHNDRIRTIRYFINLKEKNEYLISADNIRIVIIWDITNQYSIKHKINTKYGNDIYSCLLVFPHNSSDDFIITSTFNKSKNYENSSSKLYSLNKGSFIKYINNTNNIHIFYLLSWYNRIINKYYIIQFSFNKIVINSLLEDELYAELSNEPESDHFSGFIYNKDNKDYLFSSSSNGYINMWDLYNKQIFQAFNMKECKLAHIIQWNEKYIIVADHDNKEIKILDINNCSGFLINTDHKEGLKCIKKINHPIYGESLLSSAKDKMIKLWSFE